MKRFYELDVYKPEEALSETLQKHECQISIFTVP